MNEPRLIKTLRRMLNGEGKLTYELGNNVCHVTETIDLSTKSRRERVKIVAELMTTLVEQWERKKSECAEKFNDSLHP